MWLTPVLLAGSLAVGSSMPVPAVPVQSSTPQACFVFGEVFWSPSQTSALLSSNCHIKIERIEQLLVMKGPQQVVRVLIPADPGIHEFVYRWGSSLARFDDEKVEILSTSVGF